MPRVFKESRKAFQYHWYMRMLKSTSTSPLILLYRDDFSAQRLKKLRVDIQIAANSVQSDPSSSSLPPVLTVIRSSIFGAALRDFPNINLDEVEQMVRNVKGGYAVLSLPVLDPPYLNAILRALHRSVPPRPPKTQAEIDKEEEEKKADPSTPGRRMKRVKPTLVPELKVMGALIEGKVLLPERVQDVAKMPTLETLRGQIVGLLSSPSAQLAGVLSEASGGKLARTLAGLQKALENTEGEQSSET